MMTDSGIPMSFEGPSGEYPYKGHFYRGGMICEFYIGPGGTGEWDAGWSMDRYQPDYVFVHLGTNGIEDGIARGTYTHNGGLSLRDDTLPGRLANLLAYLLKWKTGERGTCLKNIIVSQLIDKPAYRTNIEGFNAELVNIYTDSENGSIPSIPPGTLRLADQYTDFYAGTMLSPDSIHPNDLGYAHMASVYMNTVHTLPMRMAHHSPSFVSGLLNNAVPELLTVKLTDDNGDPVHAADVWFEVISGTAAISGETEVITDSEGLASVGIVTTEPGVSVIRASSHCLREPSVDFTVSAEQSVAIDGFVYYHLDGRPVSDVGIKWVEHEQIVDTTDGTGKFQYHLFPRQSTVTLAPVRDRSPFDSSGILMYDAALAARHAVGIEYLDGPAAEAADVDADGSVTIKDAAFIARYCVGNLSDEQSLAGNWRFMPEICYFPSLDQSVPDVEFSALLFGDLHGGLSGTAKPNGLHSIRTETVYENGYALIQLYGAHESLLSMDGTCSFDPDLLEFAGVESAQADYRVFANRVNGGHVRLGMFTTRASMAADEILLSLRFRIKEEHASAAVFSGLYLNAERFGDITVPIADDTADPEQPGLELVNYPNPFNGNTIIVYRLAAETNVTIHIYNYLGQQVRAFGTFTRGRGEHSLSWNGLDDQGREMPSGLYFCVISTETGEKQVRKMELLR